MRLHSSQGFFVFGLGFCCGVFVGLLFPNSIWIFSLAIVLAVFLVWLFCAFLRNRAIFDFSLTVFFFASGLLCVGILLGFFPVVLREKSALRAVEISPTHSSLFEGIVTDVDQRINYTRLVVRVSGAVGDTSLLNENVLVTAPLYPEYNSGDVLQLQCRLQQPQPIGLFRYDRFLVSQGIQWTCYYPNITWLGRTSLAWYQHFAVYRTRLLRRINSMLSEPYASLLAGLLLGVRRGFPQELSRVFQRTGTSHVLAISGYNVSLVSTFLLVFAIRIGFSRKKALMIVGCGIVLFTVFVGASASVIRASLMALLMLLARYVARPAGSRQIFMLVAFLVALFRPELFVFDIGFHLSFLATLGLVYLAPFFEKVFQGLPEQWGLRENAASTLSALVATLPLTVFQFRGVSLVAMIANMAILPVIPFVMLFGTLEVILSILPQFIAFIFLWPTWLLLTYVLFVLEHLARWSWAYRETPQLPWQFIVIWYGLLCFCFVRRSRYFQLHH
ncbi:MAG: hypothetical protein A3B74_00280 [Candidatus Kerfeldbacteria bacterium RIFCSPHIGHO2_02_FULL_42_14]|uniref:ComEC/Rec2-related protein domain-containing protein n=1 Tax=Candidatus Kerfeldbacteria bacterium RIFCSPHIGHO2_02_FULL_42_14 TaxID=1798540 RepID=A0A1G2AS12_9BACT|nr:MAG: hypothetical protein A3B74_00280 [Candidatus Kerfeldbacteria bacterium RIFCSPHIGHO2_02_FULL_42_14]OGY81287.1 MAG: hypothetical protein A3E60_02450 [Candidatus Kerfeldbacteria bacterium RIFCSPHIGHO2_12_FULL_42_13]OGY83562.1 MAG: hypothetical protein A3I91_02885 [Candidatus Kerfeldbacteria bacterium RIFCSPLOWO2_02_FULL_42_19]